jgi:invasion protein IalB
MISRNSLVQAGAHALVGLSLLFAASTSTSAQDAAEPAMPPSPSAPASPSSPPAPSAPASPSSPPSPWVKVCNKNPQTEAEICVVTQELRAETGQPIAVVTLQLGREPGKYGLGIVVPIGFVLPPGIALNVDGAKQGTAQYTICIPPSNNQPSVCLAQAPVDENFVSALKKGDKLQLVVVNPQNRQIPIELSLAGFSKTFDGPGIDRAAAEAQRKQLSEALQKSAEEARKKLIEQQQKELGKTGN